MISVSWFNDGGIINIHFLGFNCLGTPNIEFYKQERQWMQAPGLPFHPKQILWAIKWYSIFKLLGIRLLRAVTPERQETNEVCLTQLSWTIASTYCRRGEPRWSTAVFLSGVGAGSLGRPRCPVNTEQSTIEERDAQIESPRVLQRTSYKPSAEYQSAHEKLPTVQEIVIQKY